MNNNLGAGNSRADIRLDPVGNGVGATDLSIEGVIYYVAMYSSALSVPQVAVNTELLLAADDTPP